MTKKTLSAVNDVMLFVIVSDWIAKNPDFDKEFYNIIKECFDRKYYLTAMQREAIEYLIKYYKMY